MPLVNFYINEVLDKQVFAPAGWINENYTDHQREVSIGGPHPVHGLGAEWRGYIDNVRFSDLTVPEPGTLALLAGGLAALSWYLWRKRS